ncbi:MAG: cytidine deaminase [Oscillospiraceae bacterium]|jgi:cytidine deaminase|nr:cytidine deaminase [Oscillospiraceae bacterium]
MDKQALYDAAYSTINHKKLRKFGESGHVACALETATGAIYTGICIDLPCSIGICAEQAAIAEMIKHNETQIRQIVAVHEDGNILPPCGRCREFIAQIDDRNADTIVLLPSMRGVPLRQLLPERWDALWD